MSTLVRLPLLFVIAAALPLLSLSAPLDVDGDGIVGPLEVIDLSLHWKGQAFPQLWQANGTNIFYNAGNVGIGTDSPLGGVHVHKEPVTAGGTLTLEGDTHAYMSFYPDGITAGRKAWFGFGGANDNNVYLVNNVGNIIMEPAVQGFHIRGYVFIKNADFGDYHNLQWDSADGRVYYDNSTRRNKENITLLTDDFERLLDAQPMTYTRPSKPDRYEIGYIAEEIEALGLSRLVQYDAEGDPEGVNYEKAVLYLVEIAKAQRKLIADQESQTEQQKERIDDLTARISRLEGMGEASVSTANEARPVTP